MRTSDNDLFRCLKWEISVLKAIIPLGNLNELSEFAIIKRGQERKIKTVLKHWNPPD